MTKIKRWLLLSTLVLCTQVINHYTLEQFLPSYFDISYQQAKVISGVPQGEWQIYNDQNVAWKEDSGRGTFQSISRVVTDSAGRVWFPTDSRSIFMFDGETWHHWENQRGASHLSAWRGLTTTSTDVFAVLSNTSIGRLAWYNNQLNLWEIPWRAFGFDNEVHTFMLEATPEGHLYVVDWPAGQLNLYKNRSWEQVYSPCGLTDALQLDKQNRIWAWDTFQLAICSFDGKKWNIFDVSKAITELDNVFTIKFDEEGRLWTMTHDTLIIQDVDGKWYHMMPEELPLQGEAIDDIAIDPVRSHIWLVSAHYLAAYDGKEWVVFEADDLGLER